MRGRMFSTLMRRRGRQWESERETGRVRDGKWTRGLRQYWKHTWHEWHSRTVEKDYTFDCDHSHSSVVANILAINCNNNTYIVFISQYSSTIFVTRYVSFGLDQNPISPEICCCEIFSKLIKLNIHTTYRTWLRSLMMYWTVLLLPRASCLWFFASSRLSSGGTERIIAWLISSLIFNIKNQTVTAKSGQPNEKVDNNKKVCKSVNSSTFTATFPPLISL